VSVWRLAAGDPVSSVLLAGLTVLVAACPCAMGLATPLAIAAGLRDALRRRIVVANSSLFETAPDVDTIVFDKTGTLTTGEMTVQSVVGDRTALTAAAAVERQSAHPVANAIVEYARSATGGGATREGTGQDATGVPSSGRVRAPSRRWSKRARRRGGGRGGHAGTGRAAAGPLSGTLQSAVRDARTSGQRP